MYKDEIKGSCLTQWTFSVKFYLIMYSLKRVLFIGGNLI